MTYLNLFVVILLSALISGSIAAANPLFQSPEPLALVLEIPLNDLLRRKSEKATVSGVLRYTPADGSTIELDVAVSSRGKSRLEQCRFPLLSINLKKKQVAATLFAGQNKLKLVTLCRNTGSNRRYLNQEYIVYRIYNLLSDYSFRVRMLEVTYLDSNGRKRDQTQPAFFIESVEEAAERQAMAILDRNIINVSQLDTRELAIFTLFQFMIGNTDWSVRKGPAAESCCHNGKVIAPPDRRDGWVVLPYDFDQAGIINTSYATPNDLLPIKSVRQRLYRGFCSGNDQLDGTILIFNDNRAAIENLFSNRPDGSRQNKAALKYVEDFYEVVNDSKKRQKQIVDKCRRTTN